MIANHLDDLAREEMNPVSPIPIQKEISGPPSTPTPSSPLTLTSTIPTNNTTFSFKKTSTIIPTSRCPHPYPGSFASETLGPEVVTATSHVDPFCFEQPSRPFPIVTRPAIPESSSLNSLTFRETSRSPGSTITSTLASTTSTSTGRSSVPTSITSSSSVLVIIPTSTSDPSVLVIILTSTSGPSVLDTPHRAVSSPPVVNVTDPIKPTNLVLPVIPATRTSSVPHTTLVGISADCVFISESAPVEPLAVPTQATCPFLLPTRQESQLGNGPTLSGIGIDSSYRPVPTQGLVSILSVGTSGDVPTSSHSGPSAPQGLVSIGPDPTSSPRQISSQPSTLNPVTSQSSGTISTTISTPPSSSPNTTQILQTSSRGFFHEPRLMMATFIPIGLILVAGIILWVIFGCKRRKARHAYGKLARGGGMDENETGGLNAPVFHGSESHVNLSTPSSEYLASRQSTSSRSYLGTVMMEQIIARPSSRLSHAPIQVSLPVPEAAMSSLVTLQTSSNVDISPVDPVDPFGPHRYSTQNTCTPAPNPFATPRASLTPYVLDSNTAAAVQWMVTNEIPIQTDHSLEPIADDVNSNCTAPELHTTEENAERVIPERKTSSMSWLDFVSECET